MFQTAHALFKLRRNGYSGPFFVGVIQFAIGAWFLLPWETFPTAESYDAMTDWATEMGWGVFLVSSSVFIIVASLRREPVFAAIGGLIAAFAFLVVTVSIGVANPEGILFPIMAVLTLRGLSIYTEFMARRQDPHLLNKHH